MLDQQMDLGTINEGSTLYLTGTVTDHLGVAVPLASVTTLKLWVTNEATGAVIDSRNGVDIKNANGGTLHATSGAWTLTLASADSPIVVAGTAYERHRILVQWSYNAGAQQGSMEFALVVRNLSQV